MRSKLAACRPLCLASTALALTLVSGAPALAQAAPADATAAVKPVSDDSIVVTGTRLSKKVTDQPVVTISGDTLANQGYTNIGQALTDQPAFGVPANSPVGGQGSYSAGQTFANLYNLGAIRTLVLVNGNRFVSSAASSIFGATAGTPVDLGLISPGLLDHVDTVSVGGAPIYGSDAIAGTVNVILKKHYEGIELNASQGISEKGDARDYNGSLLVGKNFAGGRGNITLNVYYDHQDGLTGAQRYVTGGSAPFFGQTNQAGGPQNIAYFGGARFSVVSNTGIPTAIDNIPFPGGQPGGAADPLFGAPFQSIVNSAGQSLYFNQTGQLVPFHHGTIVGDNQTEAGGDAFSYNDTSNLLVNSQRIQGTLLANFEFSDHLRFHGEAWLARSAADNVASQPLYNTALFSGPGGAGLPYANYALSTSNPFLSAADQATIKANLAAIGAPTNTFYLARANTDLYNGGFHTSAALARFVGGLDGDFAIGTHKFQWDATVNYGQTNTATSQPGLVWQNIENAINAVQTPNGIACAPGYTNAPIATLSSTCAPLDLFGLNRVSQAALNYITAPATSRQVNKQFDAVVDLKGDIVHLPAGEVRAVIGAEIRRESQSFDPGAFFAGSYSQYVAIAPVAGSYHTHEAFGELSVPLINPDMHVPLIRSLNANGAARYTNNSLNGGFWSYTGGGNWSPFNGLTFRGNYTRSFREPAVTEAYSPVASVFEAGNDPCDNRFLNGGSNPATRAANCAKAGIPANFVSTIVGSTIPGLGGGNPHLGNEIATSWTVGGAFSPVFLPGLTMTADYVHINIANEILQPGVGADMQACYDSPNYPNSPFCGDFTRDPVTHQITSFTDTFVNIGTQAYRAIQANLTYQFALSRIGLGEKAGNLSLSVAYLHELANSYVVGSGSTQYNHDAIGEPADSFTANIDWATKVVDWSWTVIYDGPTVVSPNNPAKNYQYYNVSPYWMANTSVGIKVNDRFTLRGIVKNVFNLGVSYAGPVPQFSTNKEFDAILGRSFRLSATIRY